MLICTHKWADAHMHMYRANAQRFVSKCVSEDSLGLKFVLGAWCVQVQARMMRDFVGMDRVNAETRKALLEFSYQLTRGNMDEAYKAVKLIKRYVCMYPGLFAPSKHAYALSRPHSSKNIYVGAARPVFSRE